MPSYPIFKTVIEQTLQARVEPEYRFHPVRRWRFDFAVPEHMLAIEVEGGSYVQGRHTRGKGFAADMEKYNTATLMGWSVLRYTPQQVDKCMEDMKIMKNVIKNKSNDS